MNQGANLLIGDAAKASGLTVKTIRYYEEIGLIPKAGPYIADGNEVDGNPSLRYLTLLREGARAHGLPESYLRFLDSVKHAE